jgi:probable HAF family extracellular repeat protein
MTRMRTALLVAVGLAACRDATQPAGGGDGVPALQASTVIGISGLDLGTLGADAEGLDIDNAGQIVGQFFTDLARSRPEPFFWTAAGGMTDLLRVGLVSGRANAINDRGQIVGVWADNRGFVWSPSGELVDLGDLPGGFDTEALAINGLGHVAGAANAHCCARGFVWTPEDGLVDPGTLGGGARGETWATGINDLDQVVGRSPNVCCEEHAFVWTRQLGMVDLGALGGGFINGTATGINNLGQVVGWYQNGTREIRAFLWSARSGMVDLGTLGEAQTEASAINDLGQVVGSSRSEAGGAHAFIWTREGGMTDLGTLGTHGASANGINDRGQVVGSVSPSGFDQHAALWNVDLSSLSPADELDLLRTGVANLAFLQLVNDHQRNALDGKLDAAGRQVDHGRAARAGRFIDAFADDVRALINTGVLTEPQGRPLIDAAERFITELGG